MTEEQINAEIRKINNSIADKTSKQKSLANQLNELQRSDFLHQIGELEKVKDDIETSANHVKNAKDNCYIYIDNKKFMVDQFDIIYNDLKTLSKKMESEILELKKDIQNAINQKSQENNTLRLELANLKKKLSPLERRRDDMRRN